MESYQLKIAITGGCSVPLDKLTERLRDFLLKEGFGTVITKGAKERSEPYDGFINNEAVLISVE